jgi:hypothetical protein
METAPATETYFAHCAVNDEVVLGVVASGAKGSAKGMRTGKVMAGIVYPIPR